MTFVWQTFYKHGWLTEINTYRSKISYTMDAFFAKTYTTVPGVGDLAKKLCHALFNSDNSKEWFWNASGTSAGIQISAFKTQNYINKAFDASFSSEMRLAKKPISTSQFKQHSQVPSSRILNPCLYVQELLGEVALNCNIAHLRRSTKKQYMIAIRHFFVSLITTATQR